MYVCFISSMLLSCNCASVYARRVGVCVCVCACGSIDRVMFIAARVNVAWDVSFCVCVCVEVGQCSVYVFCGQAGKVRVKVARACAVCTKNNRHTHTIFERTC